MEAKREATGMRRGKLWADVRRDLDRMWQLLTLNSGGDRGRYYESFPGTPGPSRHWCSTGSYRDDVLRSGCLPTLPYSFFRITTQQGAYEKYDRKMGRLLLEKYSAPLSESIIYGMGVFKRRPGLTARRVCGLFPPEI